MTTRFVLANPPADDAELRAALALAMAVWNVLGLMMLAGR